MNREIDKIIAVRDKLPEDEKRKIDDALEVVKKSFHAMIDSIGVKIVTDENVKYDVQSLIEALKVIKETGVNEMPTIENEKEAKIYLLKFGMELLK